MLTRLNDRSPANHNGSEHFTLNTARIKPERRGALFTLWTGAEGEPLREAGAIPMKHTDPVYVGLVVGSHANSLETAAFSEVSVERKNE
jgi:hypothetical protein